MSKLEFHRLFPLGLMELCDIIRTSNALLEIGRVIPSAGEF
jgi:hypothetical protein